MKEKETCLNCKFAGWDKFPDEDEAACEWDESISGPPWFENLMSDIGADDIFIDHLVITKNKPYSDCPVWKEK